MTRERLISFDDEEEVPEKERCGNCRYFMDKTCHRYPPELDCYQDHWPQSEAGWWCGEWQDMERTYTPNERQLDCLIDCQTMPGRARLEA